MTLTETAYWSKKFAAIAVVLFGLFIIGSLIYLRLPKNQKPPEYLKPVNTCTKTREEFLKNKLNIPDLPLASGTNVTFSIDTPTGKLQQLPEIVNVYRYNNPGQSLTAQDDAKKIAEAFGFDPEGMSRSSIAEYQWIDKEANQRLTIQARNLSFKLEMDLTKPLKLRENKLPTEDRAIDLARSFLQSANLFPSDYTETPITTLIKINPDGSLSEASSRSTADMIRVDFFRRINMITIDSELTSANQMVQAYEKALNRKAKEEMSSSFGRNRHKIFYFDAPIVNLDPQKSNISIYVGKPRDINNNKIASIYMADYKNWIIDRNPCGTYALIPPGQAQTMIQQGKGSLVYLNYKNGDSVIPYTPKKVLQFSIMDINIGYYDAPEEQTILQPIYIISGEATFADGGIGEFYYYLPAIDYSSVTDAPTSLQDNNEQQTNNKRDSSPFLSK